MLFEDGYELLVPAVILFLVERQKDLFFRLKVVVDRGTGKGCYRSDLFQRDVLKAHRLIKLLTGVYDFLFPGCCQFR